MIIPHCRPCLAAGIACVFTLALASAADFHVAPDGNDDATGSAQHPFATLARARDAARQAPAGQLQPSKPSAESVSSAVKVENLIIVFKTHFDIGYTDLASNVLARYRTTMIDAALKVVDQNRSLPPDQQFVWTLPGWPMHKIAEDWPGQSPERKARIFQALQQGRFAVHALPFTTHTELLEAEDLARALDYATRLSLIAGLSLPRDAKMTDVPCHSWILPTLLKHAGVDFLHLGCNAASRSPQIPVLFWWEGPDRSRLLTMYTAESYGTGLIPPPRWPYKSWLALIHTGDNHGPPTPGEVQTLLREAKLKWPAAKIKIGRLSDFADAILAENSNLPVVRGDMPDTWIHGPMCDPAGAKLARNIRPLIPTTETLASLLQLWKIPVANPAQSIAAASESSLLYGEHTWGGALYWVSKYTGGKALEYGTAWKDLRAQGRFQRLEASWDEHSAYIQSARDLILPCLEGELHALAQAVAVDGKRIVAFNPLPWKRNGLVTVTAAEFPVASVKSIDDNQVIPATPNAGSLSFFASDVPPLGYRTYVPLTMNAPSPAVRADPKTFSLENPFLKAVLDPARGVVRSLIDKRSGRELVDASAAHGFGQYLFERFDDDQVQAFVAAYVKISAAWATNELGKPNLPPASEAPYRAISPSHPELTFEHNPVFAAAVVRFPPGSDLPYPVTSRFRLNAAEPCLDLEITLHNKPADPWPEAGWVCLPFKVESPQFHLGRLGSIIDPATDIVPGANRHLLALETGLALCDPQGRGAGLCALDHPLVSLDRPGCWKYSTDFVPRRPAVYLNLFNNQWTTNFRLWNQGTWSSRIRVWPLEHYAPESGMVTPALEARLPLLAAFADGGQGPLPPTQAGLQLSRQGALVTAFKSQPDGSRLLRIWEHAGSSGNCEVRLPSSLRLKTVQPIDLRGQPQGRSIPVRDGRFTFPLPAFAPATFLLMLR